MANKSEAAPAAAPDAPKTTAYVVREGFSVAPRDGGPAIEAGTILDLTEEDALWYAVQIELVDPPAE
jgi:hypothetical protein